MNHGYISALGSYHHLGYPISVVVATPRSPAHSPGEQFLLVFATWHVLTIEVAKIFLRKKITIKKVLLYKNHVKST